MKTDIGIPDRIEDFISTQVTERGLDERTEKAYRQDLEHFYLWMEAEPPADSSMELKIEQYFEYLAKEKGLRSSTMIRKHKVLSYYLSYSARHGFLPAYNLLKRLEIIKFEKKEYSEDNYLAKKEIDALFQTLKQEYKELNSDFRKRVCLRDLIMLELLFYHRIEVSELLRLEISDYDQKTGVLLLCRKKRKENSVVIFSKELRRQLEMWLGEHEYFEQDNGYQNYLFLSKLGRPLSMKMIINIVEKYRLLAGIEKTVTPKDLKKSMERYAWELMMEQCG